MSEIKVDTVAEKTSANGVTIDGLNIKDSKLVTANSIVEANITDGAISAAKLASGTVQNQSAFRNIIINGNMSIAQRGTSTSSISGGDTFTLDRFIYGLGTAGTWTMSQDTDAPTGQGFSKSLKLDCTTANSSLSSGSFAILQTRVEGQNLQYLKYGTSSAESLTLSFWVKSSKTGTHIANLYDHDNSKHIGGSYTVSSANTWEKKTITYVGNTGSNFGNDNGKSLEIRWWIVAGSAYSSGTLPTTWSSASDANMAPGQVNLADNTSNNFLITGVQLEAGTTASDFEFLPVDVNFTRCQRYCQFIGKGSTSIENIVMSGYTSTNAYGSVDLPTKMRSAPSLTYTTTNVTLYNNGNSRTISSKATSVLGHSSVGLKIIGSGWSASHALHLVNSDATNGLCKLDAEL